MNIYLNYPLLFSWR